ncbi:MAG TPA: PQQ-dependent sugar dehydrogenase, partial [Chloroflexia bacterium]|nr:PQQ-dependent sugar dehydrogenase [Chloroflexia bacterium]
HPPVTWIRRGSLVLLLLLALMGRPAQPGRAAGDIFFPQTGFSLSDAHGFLSYWQAHGGLAQFGYPLSPEVMEVSPTNGRLYLTQWFERNRFEYHPENAGTPYSVLLGLLGRDLAQGHQGEAPFQPAADPQTPACRYFPETSHSLCRDFRQYWEQHGGLALYGYPLSEEFAEQSPTDGKTYTVQYFERNRFELHPEHAGTPYLVLLGLLGVQIGGFPVPAVPKADTQTLLQVPAQFTTDAKWKTPRPMTGPAGMQISLFGTSPGLRMLAVAPNGDLFVSETRSDRVLVMPDRNGDGVTDDVKIFTDVLTKPHGLAFHNNYLYVATEIAVFRFPYAAGQLAAGGPGQKIADLPFGTSQGLVKDVNHDTRSLVFGPDNKMYVSMGSDCDVCEEGDPRRASIMQFNDDGSAGRVYASGLRNAVGIDFDPRTGQLWASVNERNGRGNDFPPDYLTPIRDGGNYGWPYCLGIPLQPDPQFGRPASVCQAEDSAAVALPAHIAPLGMRVYSGGAQLPPGYDNGIFVALHGSMLHTPPYGADVRYVSLRPGQMALGPQPAISGWNVDGQYWGRPVDVITGKDGALYISDDAAGAVYRVTFGH